MGITNEGLNYALGLIFPITPNTLYVGLINNTPIPVLASGDTLPSHAGWVEIAGGTGYTGNRPLWTNGSPSGQAVTNASYVNFAMLQILTVYGIFLTTVAAGTGGPLFGAAPFVGGPQAVVTGDTLQVTITAAAVSS